MNSLSDSTADEVNYPHLERVLTGTLLDQTIQEAISNIVICLRSNDLTPEIRRSIQHELKSLATTLDRSGVSGNSSEMKHTRRIIQDAKVARTTRPEQTYQDGYLDDLSNELAGDHAWIKAVMCGIDPDELSQLGNPKPTGWIFATKAWFRRQVSKILSQSHSRKKLAARAQIDLLLNPLNRLDELPSTKRFGTGRQQQQQLASKVEHIKVEITSGLVRALTNEEIDAANSVVQNMSDSAVDEVSTILNSLKTTTDRTNDIAKSEHYRWSAEHLLRDTIAVEEEPRRKDFNRDPSIAPGLRKRHDHEKHLRDTLFTWEMLEEREAAARSLSRRPPKETDKDIHQVRYVLREILDRIANTN